MKTAAVIAEFNPFHNGHKYLLDTIKNEYGVDYCIAIMSGDYVQRGDIALVNKHKRAEMAVHAGFSAVFELPLLYAGSSAPDFAYGAASIADALGVDYLFFGSESGDTESLCKLADIMNNPDDTLEEAINNNVKSGMSYAKAVSSALIACGICKEDFSSPNDILALEYIKTLKKLRSKLEPIAIKRKGVGHNSAVANDNIASASSLRSKIHEGAPVSDFIPYHMDFKPLFMDDFFNMLSYRLHYISEDELKNTPGISGDLANKIKKSENATSYRQLIDSCKSKNFSESTIRRAFIHILLSVQKNDILYPDGHVAYPHSIRLLALTKSDSFLLKSFKEKEALYIYTKPKEIIDKEDALLLLDMKASDLYEKVYASKYRVDFIHDCQKTPLIFK